MNRAKSKKPRTPFTRRRFFSKKLAGGQWVTLGSSPYRRFWAILATMPPLSHWPNRDEPFDYAQSDVIRFIMTQCSLPLETAIRVWDSIRSNDIIKFDPESRLWSGVEGGSQ